MVESERQPLEYGNTCGVDTNALVLPAKKVKSDAHELESRKKRRKLSSKQRKRLQKVVEAKERKAKVGHSI